jgi:hypothetical protein
MISKSLIARRADAALYGCLRRVRAERALWRLNFGGVERNLHPKVRVRSTGAQGGASPQMNVSVSTAGRHFVRLANDGFGGLSYHQLGRPACVLRGSAQ